MKKTLVSLLVIFHVSVSLCAQGARKTLAITHVTVIDTASGSVKRDMTVIITGGRIAAIGKSRTVKIPTDARGINATGKFLVTFFYMHVPVATIISTNVSLGSSS